MQFNYKQQMLRKGKVLPHACPCPPLQEGSPRAAPAPTCRPPTSPGCQPHVLGCPFPPFSSGRALLRQTQQHPRDKSEQDGAQTKAANTGVVPQRRRARCYFRNAETPLGQAEALLPRAAPQPSLPERWAAPDRLPTHTSHPSATLTPWHQAAQQHAPLLLWKRCSQPLIRGAISNNECSHQKPPGFANKGWENGSRGTERLHGGHSTAQWSST